MHDIDGARIGCGPLELVSSTKRLAIHETLTQPLGESESQARVMVMSNFYEQDDRYCYVGLADKLEQNLTSYALDPKSQDCTQKNGCGTHIHSGTGCEDKAAQGGHWFNGTNLAASGGVDDDPWKLLGYQSTTPEGNAWFSGCVATGIESSKVGNLPFIVHNNAGGRVSCGLLAPLQRSDSGSATQEPTSSPVTKQPTTPSNSAAVKTSSIVFGSLFAVLVLSLV